MSAVHTCIRSALTQAFRPLNGNFAAVYSIPAFLVPALNLPSQRPFSCRKRRSKARHVHTHTPNKHPQGLDTNSDSPKFTQLPPRHITFSKPDDRRDIQQWLAALDTYLPPHLRQHPSADSDSTSSIAPEDLSRILNSAQEASQDIFSHLGLVQKRWDAVLWIVKKLVEGGGQTVRPQVRTDPFANIQLPETGSQSLDELTNKPILTRRSQPLQRLHQSIEDLTVVPQSLHWRYSLVKRALGQLWRSLGNMILVATEESGRTEQIIMPHVLEIIAYLHHVGLIPDSVYTYQPLQQEHALQQPPTLYLLSSSILAALSDATWRAHEASVNATKAKKKPSYFLGREIPESRYSVEVAEVTPELWLELVLWSCLHGGWTLDGIAILEQMAAGEKERGWGLICWREVLQAAERDVPVPSRGWSWFSKKEDTFANDEDRAKTRRTISSEVVTAFIDGLINFVRLGVGARGTSPDELIDHIKNLKSFLDASYLSLGSAAWDSIMIRFLESGGIIPEKRPELLLKMSDLAAGFGTEVSAVNASSQKATDATDTPYFFEPTTVPLSLLHRTMRSYIEIGDISGAMKTLSALQQYTDNNKQKSLRQFFETLRATRIQKHEPFTSTIPPIDFPAFENQLPLPLLAKVLDLATESKHYDFGRWLLFSEDLDGPLIGPELYGNRQIAASILRFGTMAKENDLVLKIVKRSGAWHGQHQEQRMPVEVLAALFCSQIQLHQWASVQGIQNYVLQSSSPFKPPPVMISTFAAELLRASKESKDNGNSTLANAQQAFADLLFAWESLLLAGMRNELYCILGIMSDVHKDWKKYCSRFLTVSFQSEISLSTADFNRLLGGVLDGYGSTKGKEFVKKWCYTLSEFPNAYRAPGGLGTMPRFRVSRGNELARRLENIVVAQKSGTCLTLKGRVTPNRQTMLAVLRKVKEEVEGEAQNPGASPELTAEQLNNLHWVAKRLYNMGFDTEDILRDMGSLSHHGEISGFVTSLESPKVSE